MEKLKPCPFCGGAAEIRSWAIEGLGKCYTVECRGCRATTALHVVRTMAVGDWNRRVK